MPTGVKDEKGIVGMEKGYMRIRYGRFNPLRPKAEDVDIRSIAFGLAGEYRYSSQTRFTVAQHSVVGSYYCDEPLAFLLHDATEALGFRDITTPLKHSPALRKYRELEKAALKVVFGKFGIGGKVGCAAVLSTDRAMYVTESRMLWGREVEKGETSLPLTPDQARVWGTEDAERRFLARFGELTGDNSVELAMAITQGPSATPSVIAASLNITRPLPPRPPNSFTHSEYMAENGVSATGATRMIKSLFDAGRIVPVKIKIEQRDGKRVVVGGWQLRETPLDCGAVLTFNAPSGNNSTKEVHPPYRIDFHEKIR